MAECIEIRRLTGPYLFDDLDHAERASVEAHLASHPGCRRYVAEARTALAALPVHEPTDAQLDAILRNTRLALREAPRRTWKRALAAAGVGVLVLALVLLWPRAKPSHVAERPRVTPKPPAVLPIAPKAGPKAAPSAPTAIGVVKQPAPSRPARQPQVTPAPLLAGVEVASLGEIAGQPQVLRGRGAAWAPARSRQSLATGDQVRTGPRDRITVGLGDGTRLALQPDTTLELVAAKGRPAAARVLRGQCQAWVAPGAAPFVVHTPQGRAEAVGTRFAVDAARAVTTVAVFDGRVQLSNDQGQVSLDPHTQATVRSGEAPDQPRPLERGPMLNGAPGLVADDFEGPILNRSMWILRNVDPGIQPVQADGLLRLTGSTTGTGLELESGLATNYWPRQSFSISVEVRVPDDSDLGPLLRLTDNDNGEGLIFTYSRDIGYEVSGHSWSDEGVYRTLPPFGDEATVFHTMRIVYDADSEVCQADVDGHRVGSLRFHPDWFWFLLGVPQAEAGQAVDLEFDNFRMDLRGATALPRIEAPSQPPLAQHYPTPVLWLGPPDSWESMAVYAPCVIKQGNRYLMYYAGHSRTAGWMWSHIGLATSTDGIHWEKYAGNPVLADAGEPCVLYGDFGEGRGPYYKMYYREYVGGTRDKSVIALATSPDGLAWTRRGIVLDLEPGGQRVSDPNVLYQPDGDATGDRYLLYYYTYSAPAPGAEVIKGVRLATSNDGVHFERRGPMVSSGSRSSLDGQTVGGGQVLRIGGTYHMWYTAISYDPRWRGAIAHATSPDGLHWTKDTTRLAVQGSGDPGDVFYAISGLTVLREGDAIKLWYAIMPYELHGAWETLIGYAEYHTTE